MKRPALDTQARQLLASTRDLGSVVIACALSILPMRTWAPAARLLSLPGAVRSGERRRGRLSLWERAWVDGEQIDVARHSAANRVRGRALIVRAIVRIALPETTVRGIETLRSLQESGTGALLWVAPSRDSDLITKVALARAGVRAIHLGREDHGSWRSPAGQRWLNPLVRRAEDRYLAARILIDDDNSPGTLRQLIRALAGGAFVSVRLGTQSRAVVTRRFLGGAIRVPEGPPRLAQRSGVPILPVLALPAGRGYEVRVGPAIDPRAGIEAAIDAYLAIVEDAVREDPGAFFGHLPRG